MQKSFFSWRATRSRYVLHTTAVFSFMIGAPLNGMFESEIKSLLRILKGTNAVPVKLSPVQAWYIQQGEKAFLQALSKGNIKPDDVPRVAQLFIRKPCIQWDDYMRGFSANIDKMVAMRDAGKNNVDYKPVTDWLTQEINEEGLQAAQIAIDVSPQAVTKVINRVPSILNLSMRYSHGYDRRDGTLLNYVEDELNEETDSERHESLRHLRDELQRRGAKKLEELDKKK